MSVFDTHVHYARPGEEVPLREILRRMDTNQTDRMAVIAPHRRRDASSTPAAARRETDERNRIVADLARKSRGRIIALAQVDPLSPDAPEALERAVDMGCRGLKLFNIGHYVWDERCFPTYDKCQELGVNILFHSGALAGGGNSRFHRPVDYEIMKNWPTVRCLLAHIGWPWTDECIATVGMGTHFGRTGRPQLMVDLTPGPPAPWIEDAAVKAWQYLGDKAIVFGTDRRTSQMNYGRQVLETYRGIFRKHRVPPASQEKIFHSNAMKFWGVR